ncbi:hypothetical protein GCM10029976_031930 [Kribbella albertanoniae]
MDHQLPLHRPTTARFFSSRGLASDGERDALARAGQGKLCSAHRLAALSVLLARTWQLPGTKKAL